MSGRIILSEKLGDGDVVVVELIGPDVTVNVSEAELDPWLFCNSLTPFDDEGTLKAAVNNPAGYSHCYLEL